MNNPKIDQRPLAEIFSQGDEVITGQIADTNAAWLSEQLTALGFRISRHSAVGDRLADLVGLFQEIATRAHCCIVTGGLGPTSDDLTAEAVAMAFGRPLVLDAAALEVIRAMFERRGYRMPETNRKQALLPRGAVYVRNDGGTAPGFAFDGDGCWFVCLPGVPSEMRAMFSEHVEPMLRQRFTLNPWKCVTLRTFGAGESLLQERLDQLPWPHEVILSFRAAMPEVHVKLWYPPDYSAEHSAAWTMRVAEAAKPWLLSVQAGLVSVGSGGLTDAARGAVRRYGDKLALLETVSAGRIATALETPALDVRGFACNRIEGIADWLGEAGQPDLEAAGRRLAGALLEYYDAHVALVQLWDFDHAALHDRIMPLRVVTVALASGGAALAKTWTIGGDASRKQSLSTAWGLDLLRELGGLPAPEPPADVVLPPKVL